MELRNVEIGSEITLCVKHGEHYQPVKNGCAMRVHSRALADAIAEELPDFSEKR